MKNNHWKEVAELIGIAAIVASLIFLGLEMRQQHAIARAQLGSETFDFMRSIELQMSDVALSEDFVKMIENPEDLTLEEMTRINAFLQQVVDLFQREGMLVARGIFEESDAVLARYGPLVFGNRYAQAWFRTNKEHLNPSFLARAGSRIESYSPDTSRQLYSEIINEL
jgi:hypothetical protein